MKTKQHYSPIWEFACIRTKLAQDKWWTVGSEPGAEPEKTMLVNVS